MIVIICDGSSRGNPGPASIGIVIWERFGTKQRISKPTKTISKSIGKATNMVAEFTAINEAIYYVYKKKYKDKVYIYSDSQVIINIISGRWNAKHKDTKTLYNQYCLLMSDCKADVTISWVPRQLLYLADKAANEGR